MADELVAAIVVAGGASRRMGFDKLRADLAGRPVYLHSLETLQACPAISAIVLVASEANLPDFTAATAHLDKIKAVIPGGGERHFSVQAGLDALGADIRWVAVHDAARPLLSARDLSAVIAAARENGAAALANPVADTLKKADADGFVEGSVSRENLWAMQTPQVFSMERLRTAYEKILESGEVVTDEVSAVAKLGDRVKLVTAQDVNFKVSFTCDIEMARKALSSPLPPAK